MKNATYMLSIILLLSAVSVRAMQQQASAAAAFAASETISAIPANVTAAQLVAILKSSAVMGQEAANSNALQISDDKTFRQLLTYLALQCPAALCEEFLEMLRQDQSILPITIQRLEYMIGSWAVPGAQEAKDAIAWFEQAAQSNADLHLQHEAQLKLAEACLISGSRTNVYADYNKSVWLHFKALKTLQEAAMNQARPTIQAEALSRFPRYLNACIANHHYVKGNDVRFFANSRLLCHWLGAVLSIVPSVDDQCELIAAFFERFRDIQLSIARIIQKKADPMVAIGGLEAFEALRPIFLACEEAMADGYTRFYFRCKRVRLFPPQAAAERVRDFNLLADQLIDFYGSLVLVSADVLREVYHMEPAKVMEIRIPQRRIERADEEFGSDDTPAEAAAHAQAYAQEIFEASAQAEVAHVPDTTMSDSSYHTPIHE